MAVEDFGGKVLGRQIVVDTIDHRNNGPEGAAKAREAYDGGAELALDMTNSAVALAVAGVAKEKHKLAIVTGGATSALTGANCDKYTYHYAYDTYALAASTGRNVARQAECKDLVRNRPELRVRAADAGRLHCGDQAGRRELRSRRHDPARQHRFLVVPAGGKELGRAGARRFERRRRHRQHDEAAPSNSASTRR